jgi:acetylornithine deacetylase/succinyl-diaminopimelate desuccinylase-like protein
MEKKIINDYISSNKERFLNELLDLLKIPSISADNKYSADVLKTAEAVKTRLIEAGADKVEVCPTKGFRWFMEKK